MASPKPEPEVLPDQERRLPPGWPRLCDYDAELRLHSVTFECADAQLHRFPQQRFDLPTRPLGRLRETLAAHLSDDGVWFASRAWIVTARRPGERTQRSAR
jgi:hypothetical protein